MKKNIKLLLTESDLFNLIIVVVALILSWLGASTIFEDQINLNSKYPVFLYITIATLTSSILDPLFELCKVESKKKKLFTISIGVIVGLITWVICFYNSNVLKQIQSISTRGGFSAISVSLLLLNLAYINYQLQVSKEAEITLEKEKNIELLEKNIELLKMVNNQRNEDGND